MGEWADEAVDYYLDHRPYALSKVRRQRKQESKEISRMLIKGTVKWCKILGEPHWGYENKHREWSTDVFPEEESLNRMIAEGLEDKIKDKGAGKFITFKRRETKIDGQPNQPIRVVDHHGEAWNPKSKIGNGSTVHVNFAVNEYGKNQKSANILSLQVWDHVPYEGGEFPVKEDEENWVAEVAE